MSDNERSSLSGSNWLRYVSSHAYLLYTIAFVVVSIIAFAPLFIAGKGFINQTDALRQQYGYFVDVGITIRQVFGEFFSGKGLHVPAYDLSLGYGGARAWTSDPLVYLSALCPVSLSEQLFDFLVLVRLWLVGVCAIPLAKRLGMGTGSCVVTAMAYTFSGSGLNCLLQTTALPTMALFALVVDGAVALLREKSPWRYIFFSFVFCMISGVYQLYVAQMLVAVLVATVLIVERAKPSKWLWCLAAFLGCIAFSLLMASVRMGRIAEISSLDRLSVTYDNPVLYSGEYYQRLVSTFTGVAFGERDWFIGYGAVGLLGAMALWMGKPDRMVLVMRALFVVGLVFLCVPFFGLAFNGFSYTANRWIYGFALLMSCIAGTQIPRLRRFDERRLRVCAAAVAIYGVVIVVLPYATGIESRLQAVIAFLIVAVLLVAKRVAVVKATVVTSALILAGMGINYAVFIDSHGSNWQSRMVENGSAYALLASETPAGLAAAEDATSMVRTDQSISLSSNVLTPGLLAHRVLDTYGIDYYASVYDNAVDKFHRDLALAATDLPSTYNTLDQRASLMYLLGVGYYISPSDDGMPLPYGVSANPLRTLESRDGRTYRLYGARTPSSMALLFDNVIPQSAYDALTPIQRQESLLQGVVLPDESVGTGSNVITPKLTSAKLGLSVLGKSDGVEIRDGAIEVYEPGGEVSLALDGGLADSENYLFVDGLRFDAFAPSERISPEARGAMSEDERGAVAEQDKVWSDPWSFYVRIDCPTSTGVDRIFTSAFHLYGGKSSWLWNLGYAKEPPPSVRLTFSEPGRYDFGTFEAISQPMVTHEESVTGLSRKAVSDLRYESDRIECAVNAARDGQMLFLSVPYSSAWEARVDGEPVKIERADTAFMAIRMSEGEHTVVFAYHPKRPWAFYLGPVAMVVFVAAYFGRRRFEKRFQKRV